MPKMYDLYTIMIDEQCELFKKFTEKLVTYLNRLVSDIEMEVYQNVTVKNDENKYLFEIRELVQSKTHKINTHVCNFFYVRDTIYETPYSSYQMRYLNSTVNLIDIKFKIKQELDLIHTEIMKHDYEKTKNFFNQDRLDELNLHFSNAACGRGDNGVTTL